MMLANFYILFHRPGFAWNKGSHFTSSATFWGEGPVWRRQKFDQNYMRKSISTLRIIGFSKVASFWGPIPHTPKRHTGSFRAPSIGSGPWGSLGLRLGPRNRQGATFRACGMPKILWTSSRDWKPPGLNGGGEGVFTVFFWGGGNNKSTTCEINILNRKMQVWFK